MEAPTTASSSNARQPAGPTCSIPAIAPAPIDTLNASIIVRPLSRACDSLPAILRTNHCAMSMASDQSLPVQVRHLRSMVEVDSGGTPQGPSSQLCRRADPKTGSSRIVLFVVQPLFLISFRCSASQRRTAS